MPKVKINFTEIGYLAGVSKEDAKHGCDIVVRDLSDKVKSGQTTNLLIPEVGTFICKNRITGVKFHSDVVEESKGKTSKSHYVGKLFASNLNRANLDLLDQKVSKGIITKVMNFMHPTQRGPIIAKPDDTISVTPDAENWLKNNLGIAIDHGARSEFRSSAAKNKPKRNNSARPGYSSNRSEQATSVKSEMKENVNVFSNQPVGNSFEFKPTTKKRPMSAYSGGSRRSQSSAKSDASVVPTITRALALDY